MTESNPKPPNNDHTQAEYTVQEAATHLSMGQRDLFAELRRRRILGANNVPNRRYKDAGYLREEERSYRHPAVGRRFYSVALVTERGLEWLRGELETPHIPERRRLDPLDDRAARDIQFGALNRAARIALRYVDERGTTSASDMADDLDAPLHDAMKTLRGLERLHLITGEGSLMEGRREYRIAPAWQALFQHHDNARAES